MAAAPLWDRMTASIIPTRRARSSSPDWNPAPPSSPVKSKTVDGFVLDGTPQDILIKAGEVQNLTFWNKRRGALIINKLSSQDRKTPLEGVTFKITTATGEFVPDENGKISSNGLYYTDENGQIILKRCHRYAGRHRGIQYPGYTIDESTRTQTVVENPEDTQSLYFYNQPVGGAEIIKVNEADRSGANPPIPLLRSAGLATTLWWTP